MTAGEERSAASLRRFVTFEETGEEREVKTWCLRCQADSDFTILSPTGKAHYAADLAAAAGGHVSTATAITNTTGSVNVLA